MEALTLLKHSFILHKTDDIQVAVRKSIKVKINEEWIPISSLAWRKTVSPEHSIDYLHQINNVCLWRLCGVGMKSPPLEQPSAKGWSQKMILVVAWEPKFSEVWDAGRWTLGAHHWRMPLWWMVPSPLPQAILSSSNIHLSPQIPPYLGQFSQKSLTV